MGALSHSAWALDAADQQRLNGIQQSWAHIQYELPAEQRTAAFEKLAGPGLGVHSRTPIGGRSLDLVRYRH